MFRAICQLSVSGPKSLLNFLSIKPTYLHRRDCGSDRGMHSESSWLIVTRFHYFIGSSINLLVDQDQIDKLLYTLLSVTALNDEYEILLRYPVLTRYENRFFEHNNDLTSDFTRISGET